MEALPFLTRGESVCWIILEFISQLAGLVRKASPSGRSLVDHLQGILRRLRKLSMRGSCAGNRKNKSPSLLLGLTTNAQSDSRQANITKRKPTWQELPSPILTQSP